jgi:hypothetical protein
MTGKDERILELGKATELMVQGSLSELTRQRSDPVCACAHDPARRHGPHLYFNYKAEGKAHSVYIPAEQSEDIKSAQCLAAFSGDRCPDRDAESRVVVAHSGAREAARPHSTGSGAQEELK